MAQFAKLIFGKCYGFSVSEKLEKTLVESIQDYPECQDQRVDVEVSVGLPRAERERPISNNPGIFLRYPDSYVTDFGHASVYWDLSAPSQLSVHLSIPEKNSVARFYSKLRSIEYGTDAEVFGQILHELVLIPSVYFFHDRIPIHACAISINGRGTLLAGTGGVGKTSAMLALRNEGGVSFLSDDVAVLSSDGSVYPNLAWPKIYGYNLNGTGLKSKLMSGRGPLDRLHFALRASVDPSRVRRKIHPQDLYRKIERYGCELHSVLYLFRESVARPMVENLDASTAAEMSVTVMETEYDAFHRFLKWDKYNSLVSQGTLLLDLDEVLARWQRCLLSVFEGVSVQLVKLPTGISHLDYVNSIRSILLGQDRGGS